MVGFERVPDDDNGHSMTDAEVAAYERERQEGMCMCAPEPMKMSGPSYEYGQIEQLKLSIEEGYIQLVCAHCGKQPKWFEDFSESITMEPISVRSELTGTEGDGWEIEYDGPYIELKVLKEVPREGREGTPDSGGSGEASPSV